MTDARDRRADDEALSALLDGALTAAEAASLKQRMARDSALAARLAELERADTAVRGAYRDVVDEPLPRDIVALLAADPPARGVVVELGARGRPQRRALLPLALAAGVALALGVALGVLVAPRAPVSGALLAGAGPVERTSALHAMLESQPSGSRLELGAGVTAEPRLTFATTAGDYCREIELVSSHGTTTSLACRRGDGWQIEVAAFTAVAADGGGVYRPAAGPQTAIEDAIDSSISGDPLDAEAERAALARGWTK
jgi:hypothetical protein